MGEKAVERHYTIYTIIFHATEARILLLEEQTGWALPHFQHEEHIHVNEVSRVHEVLKEQVGLDTFVLHCASETFNKEGSSHYIERIYTAENITPEQVVLIRAKWVGLQEAAEIALNKPEQRDTILECLIEVVEGTTPTLCPPWAKRGWFDQAMSWIRTQLQLAGYSEHGTVEQVINWGISCILRIPTTTDNVYFKASLIPTKERAAAQEASGRPLPLFFANEAALTRQLAEIYPEQLPRQLAANSEQGWMLTTYFGQLLFKYTDHSVKVEAFRQYSQMQIAAIVQIERLLEIGCLDRRLDKLAIHIDELVSNVETLSSTGLNQEEIAQLRQYAPILKMMCEQLADYNIPQTLVHGDLHTGNIALQEGRYTFFDWTDACIAHPFFDLVTLPLLEKQANESPSIQEVYLEQWTDFELIERLREAQALAHLLAHAHQMVSYQHIIANLDHTSRAGFNSGLTYWARSLLKEMAKQTEQREAAQE